MKPRTCTRLKFLAVVLTTFISSQQLFCREMTKDGILGLMPSMFRTETFRSEGREIIYEKIDSLPVDNPFSDLTNNNMLYLDYIITSFADIDYELLNSYNSDLKSRNEQYILMLKKSPAFISYFFEMASHYLKSKGINIKDYKQQPKLKISLDELSYCASKFFYPLRFVDSMNIAFKICAGTNGHNVERKSGKAPKKEEMYPLVEAFCAMTILNNLGNSDYNFQSELGKVTYKAGKETLSIKDEEKRIEAARDIVYKEMSLNQNLRSLLIAEYNKKKAILNYELE